MDISPDALTQQYHRASLTWPFIETIGAQYGLPRLFLYAIGSRETNLSNVRGDGGHGHGVFQLDDRFHQIPAGFDSDVRLQTITAASMLAGIYRVYTDWHKTANVYNSGQILEEHTAGGNYGSDVMSRLAFLQQIVAPQRRRQENRTVAYDIGPTKLPTGYKVGDSPDASWEPVEYSVTLPGPAGGWSGRVLAHSVFGLGGAWIQEAWWGDGHGATHTVDPAHPLKIGGFVPLVWEAPPGTRFLVIRLAIPMRGSTAFETEH